MILRPVATNSENASVGPDSAQPAAERKNRSRWSQFPGLWFLVAMMLVLCGSMAYFSWKVVSIGQENQNSARIFEQSLQASIDQFEYLPALLARDPGIQTLLQAATDRSLEVDELSADLNLSLQFAAERSGADLVYLMNLQGIVLAASNHDQPSSFIHQDYSFRPYFTRALSTLERQFYFAKGVSTGVPGFFISSPVLNDGQVIGVVVVKLELASMIESWETSSNRVLVSDENGVVILTSEPEWLYRLVRPMSSPVRQQLEQESQFPQENPAMLYQLARRLGRFNDASTELWQVDSKTWLVNHFNLPGPGWTLHHAVPESRLLIPTMICAGVLSLLSLLWVLFMIERQKKAAYSERARAAELQRAEDLQRLIDHIHIGVLVFSEDGEIHSMNDYAENLLLAGAEFRAGQGMSVLDLIGVSSTRELEAHLVDQARPQYLETWTRIGEQPVPVMYAVAQVNYDGRERYLMTLVNIAKRKRAEDDLKQLNASLEATVEHRTRELKNTQHELLQKSKAAALGKMAATIVHELSQPLSAMNSSVAALESKMRKQNWEGAAESSARLKPLSQKMLRVIRMLKYFSYEDEQESGEVDVLGLIEQLIELNRDQLSERGIELQLSNQLHQPSVLVEGSGFKLDLALSNLFKNAMDAVESSTNPRIRIQLTQDDGELRVCVEDNGGGVDTAIMGQLFNPYVTTKEVGKGVGLGLSITQEIVQQMNGRLDVVNTSEGACFSLYLPVFRTATVDVNGDVNVDVARD